MVRFYLKIIASLTLIIVLIPGCGNDETSTDSDGGNGGSGNSKQVSSINITSQYDELFVNDETRLTAEVTDGSGAGLDKSVNWSVSGPAEITSTFSKVTKLTAKDTGVVEVTAKFGDVSSQKTFDVKNNNSASSIFDHIIPSQLANPKIVFTWLVLIYEKVDIPANSGRSHPRIEASMADNKVTEVVELLRGFEEFTAQYTDSEIGYNFAVVVLDERFPLSDFRWHNGKYEWLEKDDLQREIDTYVETGWFDNIHVFYPHMGEWGPTAAWGGGGYMVNNVTRSQYSINNIDKNDWHVGTWHEAIHGLETQYWYDPKRASSVPQGSAPNGSGIELHGQPAFGYVGNDDNGGPKTQNYFHWMADLITGDIRDLTRVGWQGYETAPNTGLGFGSNGMYQWGAVRNEEEFTPGGPFPQDR